VARTSKGITEVMTSKSKTVVAKKVRPTARKLQGVTVLGIKTEELGWRHRTFFLICQEARVAGTTGRSTFRLGTPASKYL
jgi:hypothetical protein